MINFQSMNNNFHSSGYDKRRERFIQEKRVCDKELLERFAYIRKLAYTSAATRKGAWRLSGSPALNIAFNNNYFDRIGIPRLLDKL